LCAAAFTAAQADRGLRTYERSCTKCHQSDLQGNQEVEAPALVGDTFQSHWGGQPIKDLFEKVGSGAVKIPVNQTYKLKDAKKAHEELEEGLARPAILLGTRPPGRSEEGGGLAVAQEAFQRRLLVTGNLQAEPSASAGARRGTRALIDFLYHRARPFLFSTSHPPAVAAACIAAIDVLVEEPHIIDRLWENTRFFQSGLASLGFNTGSSQGPITPVIVGDGALAMKLSDRLFDAGVFAQGIAFPTVAIGKARVRTIVTATHTQDELQFALDTFGKVGRDLGIVQ
jgi:hypothetical protein